MAPAGAAGRFRVTRVPSRDGRPHGGDARPVREPREVLAGCPGGDSRRCEARSTRRIRGRRGTRRRTPERERKGTRMAELNSGDTAWILVSAALVMMMTPALAFFYGG